MPHDPMTAASLLEPCPFCGESVFDLRSPGLDGNPRYQHPDNDCAISGHMFGGEGLAARWSRRARAQKEQKDG